MSDGPDPDQMNRFCGEIVPGMLIQCGVDEQEAGRVAADIRLRAEAATHLNQERLEILAAPFFEESFDHQPTDAPQWLKAITTLVVRNSLLEEVHAHGPVNSGGIQAITTFGLGPLSHLIAAARRRESHSPIPEEDDPFAMLHEHYPRAWACLAALRDSLNEGGGRVGFRLPTAPIPKPPSPAEIVEAPAAESFTPPIEGFDAVVLSGIDPRIDQSALTYFTGESVLLGVSALSRIARHSGKLMRILDYLLAHDSRVITTNHLLTSREVYTRRAQLVKPDSMRPVSGIHRMEGISGAHLKTVKSYIAQLQI